MEHIAKTAASMRSTESLGDWAGQLSLAEQARHCNSDDNNLVYTPILRLRGPAT